MNTKRLADLLGVVPNTVRRWCETYGEFLQPTATPDKGRARVLTPHDQQVLLFVSTMRDAGEPPDEIMDRLRAMQSDGWQGLPSIPPEWEMTELISLPVAASRAHELAQVAVLQQELGHVNRALEAAIAERAQLQEALSHERDGRETLLERLTEAQLTITRLEGQIETLQARLELFLSLSGGKPRNLLLVFAGVIVITAAFVLVVVVLAGLL